MNIKNIERTIQMLQNDINPLKFNMNFYRHSGNSVKRCESVACIIGHATMLDKKSNINNYKSDKGKGDINFERWSENFFGIHAGSDVWDYMFSSKWAFSRETNSIEHAVFRMQDIIEGYDPLPIDDEIIKILVDENTITKES